MGNVGGDYTLRGMPLTLGGNLNWTPSTLIQTTAEQSTFTETKVVYDMYGRWKISPTSKVRISVNNLLPRNYVTAASIAVPSENQLQTTESKGSTHPLWMNRWEANL